MKGIFFWPETKPQELILRQNLLQDTFETLATPDLAEDGKTVPRSDVKDGQKSHPHERARQNSPRTGGQTARPGLSFFLF